MTDPGAYARDYIPADLEAHVDHAFQREPALPSYKEFQASLHRHQPTVRTPRLIALCGNPHAGKSAVQRILERHGYTPKDDAGPVRDFAMRHFGLTLDDVTTQAGKDRYTEVNGEMIQNRAILGKSANALETQFGDHILPWMALRDLQAGGAYSFGSVRRDQARTFKAAGAMVLGIRRPDAPPSPHEFDRFDPDLVDIWIDNDGTLDHLAVKVTYALQGLRLMRPA